MRDRDKFLPISIEDMVQRGISALDFILVTGDAYVDANTFGAAIIGRCLEDAGYTVGIIAQPDFTSAEAFGILGKPRMAALVTAGNMDSMVSNYTPERKRRHKDMYSPGGAAGLRPDRATIVYCNAVRRLWQDVPIVIGGVEASLRRFAHYDYISDKVRRSILVDSRADLLVYGMGEAAIVQIAHALGSGMAIGEIQHIPGTCYRTHTPEGVEIPSFEAVSVDKDAFCDAFVMASGEADPFRGRPLWQHQGSWAVVQNPPQPPLTTEQMDSIYELPYAGSYHPDYEARGGVPALQEVEFSLTSHRGCFGNCSFCSIAMHQGRRIQKRSIGSLVREAATMANRPNFGGIISDVGGPTANFRVPPCGKKDTVCGTCLSGDGCSNLAASHTEYVDLLRQVRGVPGVKRVFVRSGVRYDYVMRDPDDTFLRELCQHHISGQLRIAPEHTEPEVTALMNKSGRDALESFIKKFYQINSELGKDQYLVCYFMTSHPGCTVSHCVKLAQFLKKYRIHPREVQDFTPTPGTLSTCMYYTEMNPYTKLPVHVAKSARERAVQKALAMYWDESNNETVRGALLELDLGHLIGCGPDCLVPQGGGRRAVAGSGSKASREPQKTQKTQKSPKPQESLKAPKTGSKKDTRHSEKRPRNGRG